ncbi:uncharacterized protein K452DRAFT_134050 [Aplosporella prunicola CBS 121167]|uniref:Uncharacterized protein n=1 Tax=Aplosporella prunicola CBS 121167 TaxID=1176127 RepID=A0A6A6BP64_9PEZI|nr:uncharacterized protein K452DRAFT_134050 [Aplosporella prunicola CBS 121167]KAF2145055.1 hypothetical protein K452DRAFT_134050 [Aplosporella prunicola CBS 121167]
MRGIDSTAGAVYTWNAIERFTRCWEPQPERRNQCMIVDEQTKSIVILAVSETLKSSRFTAKRYTLDGALLSEHFSDVCVNADFKFTDSLVAEPMDYNSRLYHLRDRNLSGSDRWSTSGVKMCSVVFDNQANKFILSAEPSMWLEGKPAKTFRWKTVVYFISRQYGLATYESWRKNESRSNGGESFPDDKGRRLLFTTAPATYPGYKVLRGNEQFVVEFARKSLMVWCFDRGVELPASSFE